MDPITLTLLGASLAGGIIKAFSGKKVIDPNWLKQHFGAAVVNQEMIDLFNHAISSPQGQRIMTSAAEQGAHNVRPLRLVLAQVVVPLLVLVSLLPAPAREQPTHSSGKDVLSCSSRDGLLHRT
jgi:hypothetical protein